MRRDVFSGRDLGVVCDQARAALGDDAMIISTRSLGDGVRTWIEVEAIAANDVNRFVGLVTPRAPEVARGQRNHGGRGPYVVALVGPTGAGKTTTLAKLAVNPTAFGGHRVGFLTLDTYRACGVEQLEAYADAAGLPCEVAYDRTELSAALKRLASCSVILVDTPGRGPRMSTKSPVWRSLLQEIRATETHLVVPATMRPELVTHLRTEYAATKLTHTLVTKLDEVPVTSAVAASVAQIGLPSRWVTDGQDVPRDLHPAGPALLSTLGLAFASTGHA